MPGFIILEARLLLAISSDFSYTRFGQWLIKDNKNVICLKTETTAEASDNKLV